MYIYISINRSFKQLCVRVCVCVCVSKRVNELVSVRAHLMDLLTAVCVHETMGGVATTRGVSDGVD